MLSRRLLRIKVMQMLYAYFTRDNKEIQLTEKELSHSIFKAFELYHYLLLLIIEIRDFTANKIEFARNKYRPSDKELNQSEKFIMILLNLINLTGILIAKKLVIMKINKL